MKAFIFHQIQTKSYFKTSSAFFLKSASNSVNTSFTVEILVALKALLPANA